MSQSGESSGNQDNRGHKNYGDASKINTADLPDFDLLVGGFPCQAFSIAGLRRGFEDTRGTLFFEIVRILADKRPRYFLLENVKGLLSHDSGKTFQTILGVLTNLGYDTQWAVLNSKNFGVPQNRERVFFAGCLGGWGGREVFSFGECRKVNPEKDAQRNAYCQQGGNDKHRGTYIRTDQPCSQAGRDKPDSVNSIRRESYTDDMRIRRLTPTECERLQAFPDGWTEFGADGQRISDTQRYKCLGNAVTTSVVEWVIGRMFNAENEEGR